MKKLLLLTLLISIQSVYSQNRFTPPSMKELPPLEYNSTESSKPYKKSFFISEKSSVSNLERERYYLLEVTNDDNKSKNYDLKIENTNCNVINKEQLSVDFEFYNASKSKKITDLTITSKGKSKFYLKTTVPLNSKLSTWNCSYVVLYNPINNQNKKLLIKTSIQDPKNAQ